MVGFTQALAMELAPAGITVNTVGPGPVDTKRVDHYGRREDGTYDESRRAAHIAQLSAANPLGRLATPRTWPPSWRSWLQTRPTISPDRPST